MTPGESRWRGGWRPSRPEVALVGAITLVGLLLRLPSLGDSLFGDELSTYFTVTGHGLRSTIDIVRSDQELTPPLYYALAWFATKLGNPSESLRLVSLLAGVAAIPVTYLVGVRTVGRRAALVGAALVALSPFMIFYSTEARAYALVLLLGLLSTLALLLALDTGRTRWWIAYAVCSGAAFYTHYTVVFLLAAQLVWALWTQPRARVALLVASGGVLVGALPWLSEFRADRRSPCAKIIGALQPFNLDAVRTDVGRWSMGHPFVGLMSIPGTIGLAVLLGGLGAGALGAGLAYRARPPGDRRRLGSRAVLVIVLALALPIGAALASTFGSSVFLPRNLIASWPDFALVAGALVGAAPAPLRVIAPALLLCGFAIGAAELLPRRFRRPDYAAAVRFIDRSAGRGDLVVDQPSPTPGPLTAVDVAYARFDKSAHPPVLRLGYPSLATELRARRPGGVGPCASAFIPAPSAQLTAARAASLARGGTIFLVSLGRGNLQSLRAAGGSPLGAFVGALPARFRPAGTRVFPGLGSVGLSVYVFRDSAPAASTSGPVR